MGNCCSFLILPKEEFVFIVDNIEPVEHYLSTDSEYKIENLYRIYI